jgi:hypothetical protein
MWLHLSLCFNVSDDQVAKAICNDPEIFTKQDSSNVSWERNTLKGEKECVESVVSTCCFCNFNTFFLRSQHVVFLGGTGCFATV